MTRARGAIGRTPTLLASVLALLTMAPTAGDVGGCGTTAKLLDRDVYAEARKAIDCERCRDCGVTTERCLRACDPKALPEIALPVTCRPLYRDGEVCVRALTAASCETFASYVDDDRPSVPTECDFCKVGPEHAPSFGDGGSAEVQP